MIWTVMQISFKRLLHNRVELLLTFIVPIAFFSVFAVIFGQGIGSGKTPKIKVVAVDEVDSTQSQDVVATLRENEGLRFMRDADDKPLSRNAAEQMVRMGTVTLAIVVTEAETNLSADLLSDASDQVSSQVVGALVSQALAISAVPSPQQIQGPNGPIQQVSATAPADSIESRKPVSFAEPQAVAVPVAASVHVIDVMGEGKANPVVSMYAAGIAVMFLLFGATGGGGALLEERENQTLDRLLSSGLTMDQLLLGKWFYLTLLGVLQVTIMFAWGQAIFGVDLLGHLDGFFIITLVTAGAAAAFGLLLATLCKTRGQLNGLSVILILTMSALGGSMVPRYVMSDSIREAGKWTFNAWALDGYDKIFWRELPVNSLTPQLFVLVACGVAFLLTARVLAIRWETN